MTLRFKSSGLIIAGIAWWLFFYMLSLQREAGALLDTVGFLTLMLLPGALTMLSLRIRSSSLIAIALMLGFSVGELMIVGLLGNALFPFLGVTNPLSQLVFLTEFTGLIGLLSGFAWYRPRVIEIAIPRYKVHESGRTLFFAFAPTLFVPLSILGAFRLNSGGDGTITLIMLLGIAVYFIALVLQSKKIHENVPPIGLFFVSLSLLFMTSLRGSGIVGHDIQREFFVFELAKNAGLWSIDFYKDAYNACISITILPTIFSTLLKLADPFVYKVLFQILFATVPSLLYAHVRRFLASETALLAVLYFIAFPTFFIDMPFLNRQEIAFFFLALMIYVLFDDTFSRRARLALASFFGVSLVLSHYSTTYIMIALFAFVVTARLTLRLLGRFVHLPRIFPDSGIEALRSSGVHEVPRITVVLVALLMVVSFFWSSVLTDTSSNSLYRVFAETMNVIRHNGNDTAQSSDVLYSIFSWKKVDMADLFAAYENQAHAQVLTSPKSFYPAKVVAQYPVVPKTQPPQPLTLLGNALIIFGFDVPAFQYSLHQVTAKILQILVLIGVCATLWRARYFSSVLPTDIFLLAAGSVIMLLAIIALPVLSVEYGLLRAFQQSLMFLGIFVVAGSYAVLSWATEVTRSRVALALAILFFLSSTGALTQLLGGYEPLLHLNNSGSYYDHYYVHDSERAAIEWMKGEVQKNALRGEETVIQSDTIAVGAASFGDSAEIIRDIYPALIRKDAYVFMSVTNVSKQQATFSYNGTEITYFYPLQFLDATKTMVYTDGETRIYR